MGAQERAFLALKLVDEDQYDVNDIVNQIFPDGKHHNITIVLLTS